MVWSLRYEKMSSRISGISKGETFVLLVEMVVVVDADVGCCRRLSRRSILLLRVCM